MAPKTKRGRKPSPNPRIFALLIRLTEEEDELIREAAKWAGQRIADFARTAVIAAVRRTLRERDGTLPSSTTVEPGASGS